MLKYSLMISLLMIFCNVSVASAGGFHLKVEIPDKADAKWKDAVLVVRTFGCHIPTDAKVLATAEGIVKGQRRSVPLTMTHVGDGVYAINRQWPAEGNWVVAITGEFHTAARTVLVEIGQKGEVRIQSNGKDPVARVYQRKLQSAEIQASLQ